MAQSYPASGFGVGAYGSNKITIAPTTTNFVNGKTVMVAFVFVRGTTALTLTKPAGWNQIGAAKEAEADQEEARLKAAQESLAELKGKL